MTRKETTAIALKCFAIYVLVQLIIVLPQMVMLSTRIMSWDTSQVSRILVPTLFLMSIIFGVAIAFLIWKTTNSLMTKETTPDETGTMSVNDVMKLILACMGVYFVIDAIVALPHAILSYQIARMSQNVSGNTVTYLLSQVLEVIFGGLLIAKPAKWVKAIRSIGGI